MSLASLGHGQGAVTEGSTHMQGCAHESLGASSPPKLPTRLPDLQKGGVEATGCSFTGSTGSAPQQPTHSKVGDAGGRPRVGICAGLQLAVGAPGEAALVPAKRHRAPGVESQAYSVP